MQRIPLFPLGTVLLPGSQLPMRIFEPRYLRLVADLLALPAPERRFGVVAIRRGHEVGDGQAGELYNVGCEGVITELERVGGAEGEQYRVLLTGRTPFRIEQLLADDETPYAVAGVEWLPDESGAATAAAATRELREAHADYLRALGAKPVELTDDPRSIAYEAADRSLLGLAEKQAILEERDVTARTSLAAARLRAETGLITRLHAVPHQQSPGGISLN